MRNLAIRHALGICSLGLVFVAASPASAEHGWNTVAFAPKKTVRQLELEKRGELTKINAQYDAERRKLDAQMDHEIRRAKGKTGANKKAFRIMKDRLDIWFKVKSTNLDNVFRSKRAKLTADFAVAKADITGKYRDHRTAVEAQRKAALVDLDKLLVSEKLDLDAEMAAEINRAKGKSRGDKKVFRVMKDRLDAWYAKKQASLAQLESVRRSGIEAKFVPLSRDQFLFERDRRLAEEQEEILEDRRKEIERGEREEIERERRRRAREIERERARERRAREIARERERARRAEERRRIEERERREELRRQREREERRREYLRKKRLHRELAHAASVRDSKLAEAEHRFHRDYARAKARLRYHRDRHGHRIGRRHHRARRLAKIRAELECRLEEERQAIHREYRHAKRAILRRYGR